jgi:glucose/mannose-6-phosphate isomerase
MVLNDLKLWPEKLATGLELSEHFFDKHRKSFFHKSFKEIVFVGMGGSGIAGKIVKNFFDRESLSTRVSIIDSPDGCKLISHDALVFLVSYSGNTWETIEILKYLVENNISVIIVSHGGKARKIAEEHSLPFVAIPESISPRSALGYFLGFIFGFLSKLELVEGKEIVNDCVTHAVEHIQKFSEDKIFEPFLRLLKERDFFHIWGVSLESDVFAFRAQTQFNENSKIQAISSVFPELCHNLIVGFTKSAKPPVVLFCYTDYVSEVMKKAIKATEDVMVEKGVLLYKIPIFGNTATQQLFNIVLWSDFASYFLGVQRGVDINSVHVINSLKEKHKQANL